MWFPKDPREAAERATWWKPRALSEVPIYKITLTQSGIAVFTVNATLKNFGNGWWRFRADIRFTMSDADGNVLLTENPDAGKVLVSQGVIRGNG